MRRPYILAFLLLAAAALVPAGETSFFTTIGSRDGLPNSSVSAIVQDGRGFLWFGTQGGLVRYDGYAYKLFESEPFDTASLSHNQIQTLFLDGDVLWVGTYGGLDRFDLPTERFRAYRSKQGDASSLVDDLVISIAKDAAGRLWVGTAKGLCRMDAATGAFVRYPLAGNSPGDPGAVMVRALHLDAAGTFWVGTGGAGLFRYDQAADRFVRAGARFGGPRDLPSPTVMSIAEDARGTLYFGCWPGGVAKLEDRSKLEFRTFRLEDERVYFVNAQDGDRVLAGTWGGGLFELDPQSGKAERRRSVDGPGSLAMDVVYAAFLDSSGTFWIGTNGGGLSRAEPTGKRYQAFLSDPKRSGSLSSGKVTSIIQDRLGRLWVGVYGGGLNRWDPKTGGFIHYRHDKGDPRSLADDIVNDLFLTRSGELWVCTNDGLCRYDYASDSFSAYRHVDSDPRSLADSVTYSVAEAPDGDLWIGTYRKGLDRLRRATGEFIHYPVAPDSPAGTGDSLVYCLRYDSAGRLWIGMNMGLDRYEGNRFVHYRYDAANQKGISANTVRSILSDSKNRLWFGTGGGGLLRWDEATDSFVHFTKRDGLPHNMVRSILEANDGSIWVGTSTGIGVIDPSAGEFRSYSVYNDLKDRDFHIGAWKSPDGSLYFGGMNAVYRLQPSENKASPHKPRVLVSELKLGGKSVSLSSLRSGDGTLRLPYDHNDFSISFSAVDFRDTSRNLYSYRLDGFDPQWSPAHASRTATYTNLPGGDYVFRLAAADSEGYWNNEALALKIEVASPPWLSPLAFCLYFAILVGVGYLVASLKGQGMLRAKVVELTRLKGELETANLRLADLSMIDGLTGIPNRRKLADLLPRVFAEAVRSKKPLSVLMLDLDFFKGYNDRYGHLKGDEALRSVAAVLARSLDRATDLAARFGGEEFIVVLPDTDRGGALRVAERVRRNVELLGIPNAASKVSKVVTLSIGVATAEPDRLGGEEALLESADAALYRAKTEGRNRVL